MSYCEEEEELKMTFQPQGWQQQPEGRLLVLDSSFNPPTLAHQAVVEATVAHFGPDYFSSALLLFTTHNADKGNIMSDAPHRLAMMSLLAETLSLPTAVAVTHFPRFIDKAEVLLRAFGPGTIPYFIMGYDTMVRFLHPMYYAPLPVAEAIAPFFEKARLVCVDREGYGSSSKDMDRFWQTSDYRDKMTRVRLPDPAVARISSTLARKQEQEGNMLGRDGYNNMVCPGVAEYIRINGLYRS